jgi:cytochrome P450
VNTVHYPPGPNINFPVYYFLAMRRHPLRFLSDLARDYGDICHFKSGRQHIYLINDPELVKEVLVTQSRHFNKGRTLSRARRILGSGLLTSEGEVHRRQRRLIQPAFHHQRIAAYGQVMVECGVKTASRWRAGQTLDVAQEMTRLTVQIVGKALFDPDFEREAEDTEAVLAEILAKLDALRLPFAGLFDILPTPATLRFKRARARMDGMVYRMMNERRAAGARSDLLSMLMLAADQNDPERAMSERQVRDEIFTFILAGSVSTTNALTWTWHLLSQHPEEEQRLHLEIDAVLQGELPTLETMGQLTFTRMVLSESLRLFPPVWLIGRRAIQDCEIGGYLVPRGAIVMMSQYLMHRHPRYYPDPSRFLPSRWTAEAEAQRPKFAFFPFAAGPRGCIGESFAWMEGILLIAILSQRWKLRPVRNFPVIPSPDLILHPKHGLRMTVQQRSTG